MKTIFFNTSAEAYLSQDSYLEKIRNSLYTLSCVHGLRIWWRPHPKFRETIKASSEEDYKKYKDMITEFCSDERHIFDESGDFEKAVKTADYYYGEGGTVSTYFSRLGKPVFYQRKENKETIDDFINLYDGGSCHFAYKGRMYGFPYYINLLFEIDPVQEKISLKTGIPNYPAYSAKLSEYPPQEHHGRFYFMPGKINEVPVYNPETEEWKTIKLEIEKPKDLVGPAFNNILFFENEMILTPFAYGKIIRYDLETKRIKNQVELETSVSNQLIWGNAVITDNRVLIVNSLSTNDIAFVNLRDNSIEIKQIGDGDAIHSHIDYYKNELIIVEKNRLQIIRYDLTSEKAVVIDSFPKECLFWGKTAFGDRCSKIIDGVLYTFPSRTNMAIRFNLKTNEIKEIKELTSIFNEIGYDTKYSIVDGSGWDGHTVFLQCQNGKLLIYNTSNHKIEILNRRLSIDTDDKDAFIRKVLNKVLDIGENINGLV